MNNTEVKYLFSENASAKFEELPEYLKKKVSSLIEKSIEENLSVILEDKKTDILPHNFYSYSLDKNTKLVFTVKDNKVFITDIITYQPDQNIEKVFFDKVFYSLLGKGMLKESDRIESEKKDNKRYNDMTNDMIHESYERMLQLASDQEKLIKYAKEKEFRMVTYMILVIAIVGLNNIYIIRNGLNTTEEIMLFVINLLIASTYILNETISAIKK